MARSFLRRFVDVLENGDDTSCLLNLSIIYFNPVVNYRERKLASVAFPVVYSPKRGFPPEPGCHLAIRK